MLKRPDAHEASASVDRASGVGFASFPRGLGDAAASPTCTASTPPFFPPPVSFGKSGVQWWGWRAGVRAVSPTGEFCVRGCLSFGHQPFVHLLASLARYMPSLVISTGNKQQKRNRAPGFFSTCICLNLRTFKHNI